MSWRKFFVREKKDKDLTRELDAHITHEIDGNIEARHDAGGCASLRLSEIRQSDARARRGMARRQLRPRWSS